MEWPELPQGHSYRCQSCGRSVSLGATCACNVVLSDDRIAAALERIAAAMERLVPDGRHTQQRSAEPITHTHGPTEP